MFFSTHPPRQRKELEEKNERKIVWQYFSMAKRGTLRDKERERGRSFQRWWLKGRWNVEDVGRRAQIHWNDFLSLLWKTTKTEFLTSAFAQKSFFAFFHFSVSRFFKIRKKSIIFLHQEILFYFIYFFMKNMLVYNWIFIYLLMITVRKKN